MPFDFYDNLTRAQKATYRRSDTVATIPIPDVASLEAALALIELGMGALFVLEFIYLLFFWQAATFRVERAPELIQLLNDMAWIPFIGISSTLIMQAMVFGWAILVAVPLGVFAAWKHGRAGDWGVMAFTQVGISIPNFWFGILLVLTFAVTWQVFPAGGFPGWANDPPRYPGQSATVLVTLASSGGNPVAIRAATAWRSGRVNSASPSGRRMRRNSASARRSHIPTRGRA